MRGKSAPTTTTALLRSLKDPAQGAVWGEFDARYRPLITAFALRLGLVEADAEDVAQETLVEFLCAYRDGKYDRSRGRLSSWVISIARHRIAHRRLATGKDAARRGESAFLNLGDASRLAEVWEDEQRRLIVVRAMELLREGRTAEPTVRAFELFAVRGVPAEEVARECGMTLDDVYAAKSRVAARLREIIEELTAAWREDE